MQLCHCFKASSSILCPYDLIVHSEELKSAHRQVPSAYDLFSVRSLLRGEYLYRCTRVGSLLDVSMGSSFVDV